MAVNEKAVAQTAEAAEIKQVNIKVSKAFAQALRIWTVQHETTIQTALTELLEEFGQQNGFWQKGRSIRGDTPTR